MEQPDALVSQCKNIDKMPDGEDKESMKAIAEEIVNRYAKEGGITHELRDVLVRILRGESSR